jgi:hypothetical protein
VNPFSGPRVPRGAIALFGALLLTLAVACGDDPVGPEVLEGTYQLVQVNGQDLPAQMLEQETQSGEVWAIYVTAGSLTLKEAQSHSSVTVSELWIDGELDDEAEFSVDGSYSVSGDSITLVEGNHVLRGTFSGNRIEVSAVEPGFGLVTWTYEG